jgi:hypothetical protein
MIGRSATFGGFRRGSISDRRPDPNPRRYEKPELTEAQRQLASWIDVHVRLLNLTDDGWDDYEDCMDACLRLRALDNARTVAFEHYKYCRILCLDAALWANAQATECGFGRAFARLLRMIGIGGRVVARTKVNVTVRGSWQYAKDLFRRLAGRKCVKIMRDRASDRIKGVRTRNARVFLRPKGGARGVIANVEFITRSGKRINIHIVP